MRIENPIDNNRTISFQGLFIVQFPSSLATTKAPNSPPLFFLYSLSSKRNPNKAPLTICSARSYDGLLPVCYAPSYDRLLLPCFPHMFASPLYIAFLLRIICLWKWYDWEFEILLRFLLNLKKICLVSNRRNSLQTNANYNSWFSSVPWMTLVGFRSNKWHNG